MNRGSGKHLCRTCEQNLHWLSVDVEPDSGILGLQAGEDVKADLIQSLPVRHREVEDARTACPRPSCEGDLLHPDLSSLPDKPDRLDPAAGKNRPHAY